MKKIRIYNKTKKRDILVAADLADSFWSRFRGLLGRRQLQHDEGIVLRPCKSIHTVGMRFRIDVAFLNIDYKVIRIITGMKTMRFSPVLRDAFCVIELKEGMLSELCIEVGDELTLSSAIP